MTEAIVRCGCGGIKTYVENSMAKLFPKKNLSDIPEYVGKGNIANLISAYPNTNLAAHMSAISKKSGRFAYYVTANDEGDITSLYNLINGNKVL